MLGQKWHFCNSETCSGIFVILSDIMDVTMRFRFYFWVGALNFVLTLHF